MKKTVWWIVGVVIVVITIILVSRGGSNNSSGPIKIGFIGPLTGDAAAYGLPFHNTIQLAVDEINAKDGVNGRKLQVIYEDGKCNGSSAVSSAQKLISIDKVQVIIGGFCSGETIPIVPVAAEQKVLVLSPGASSPLLTDISPFFFRTYPSDATQGRVLAELSAKKGLKTIAFIQEQTD